MNKLFKFRICAHTTDFGWSFEGAEIELLGKNDTVLPTGLSYTFEATSYEEAQKKAEEFIFYFEQEYIGEDAITEYYEED